MLDDQNAKRIMSLEENASVSWPVFFLICVTLEHKTSLKSMGCICSNNQKYIVWIKIIHFSFMPKIIRILSKDHVP